MYLLTDITPFMSGFIDIMINIFTFVYNTLDSITFFNISLLQYIVTILVLYPVLTLLFTLVTNEAYNAKNVSERAKHKRGDN